MISKPENEAPEYYDDDVAECEAVKDIAIRLLDNDICLDGDNEWGIDDVKMLAIINRSSDEDAADKLALKIYKGVYKYEESNYED